MACAELCRGIVRGCILFSRRAPALCKHAGFRTYLVLLNAEFFCRLFLDFLVRIPALGDRIHIGLPERSSLIIRRAVRHICIVIRRDSEKARVIGGIAAEADDLMLMRSGLAAALHGIEMCFHTKSFSHVGLHHIGDKPCCGFGEYLMGFDA